MLNVTMTFRRHSKMTGFTLIELLVIISTIGILATIGVVSWNGVKTSSENKTRISELNQWKSTFDLYKTRFAVYPSPTTNGTYCIGEDFPSNKCGVKTSGNYNYSSDSSLNAELKRTGTLPKNTRQAVDEKYLGPFATFTATQISLTVPLKGDSSTCPSETTYDTASPSGVAYCKITLTR